MSGVTVMPWTVIDTAMVINVSEIILESVQSSGDHQATHDAQLTVDLDQLVALGPAILTACLRIMRDHVGN